MDPSSTSYISHVDGVIRFSQNIASASWAIFTPFHTLVLSNGMCIGYATNNQAKYDAMIGFLVGALTHRIHLHVHLDSLLLFI